MRQGIVVVAVVALGGLGGCRREARTTAAGPPVRRDASTTVSAIDAGTAPALDAAVPTLDAAAPVVVVEPLPATRGPTTCKPVRDARDDADPLALGIEICSAKAMTSSKVSRADPDDIVAWLRRPVAGASKILWWEQVDSLNAAYLTYNVDARLPSITVIVSTLREPPDHDGDGKPDRLGHRFGSQDQDFATWDVFMSFTPDASAIAEVETTEDSGD